MGRNFTHLHFYLNVGKIIPKEMTTSEQPFYVKWYSLMIMVSWTFLVIFLLNKYIESTEPMPATGSSALMGKFYQGRHAFTK